ncbi:MAG: alpha/beta hydrolase [Gammaproteobacteria bacterium]|nr:alpha/beta hydrolase [Gammaproteobacteria bacterium]MCP5137117.1 alpha/beta hydrolase [Gammaproteobacteria bacterium]
MNLDPRVKRLLLIALGLSFVPAIFGWLAAQWVFRPNPTVVSALPGDLNGEALNLQTADNVALRAWYLTPPQGAISGAVLLLHCRGCNRGSMLDRARFLVTQGYATLLPDFRGEGGSEPVLRGMGLYEVKDVEASLAELHKRVGEVPLAIVGRSKGAAAAVYAHPDVDALVLESMYSDFLTVVEHRLVERFGEWSGHLAPLIAGPLAFGMEVNRHQAVPIGHLATIRTPALIIGGDRDSLVPWSETQALYDVKPGEKALWRLVGAGHVDAYRFAPLAWQEQVGGFLRGVFSRVEIDPVDTDETTSGSAASIAAPSDVPRLSDVP